MDGIALADLTAMAATELFQPVGRTDLESIAAFGKVRQVPAGELLFEQGDHLHHFYVICEGVARSQIKSTTTIYPVPISAPEVVGWMSLIYPYLQVTQVVTETACRVLSIPVDEFRHFLDSDDALRAHINHQLAVIAIRRIHSVLALLNGEDPLVVAAPA